MNQETLLSDPIWFKNIRVLFLRPSEIIPTRDQSDAERVNAIVRLVLYCSLAVALVRSNVMYLVLGLAIIVIVTLAFAMGSKKKKTSPTRTCDRPRLKERRRIARRPRLIIRSPTRP